MSCGRAYSSCGDLLFQQRQQSNYTLTGMTTVVQVTLDICQMRYQISRAIREPRYRWRVPYRISLTYIRFHSISDEIEPHFDPIYRSPDIQRICALDGSGSLSTFLA
jgi:hypothetical protein